MARDIVVGIIGDSSKFSKATSDAVQKTESLTGKLKNVGKGMAIGAGIGAFNLLAGAISMGISKLGEMHDAYLEDQAGQALLAQALKNNIPNYDASSTAAEDYAGSLGKLGFADDEVRVSLATLVGTTHNLTEAQKLNGLAMDLARAKNISLEAATDAVSKASIGNGRALKSLGIDVAEAGDAAEFLDAIQKNVKGSAEAWAGTNEGKLAASNIKVGEAMEKVGGIVDKVSQVAVPILADALVWLADTLGTVWDAIQPVVSVMADVLGPVIQTLGGIIGTVFGAAAEAVKVLVSIWKTEFGIVAGVIKGVVNVVIGAINWVIGAVNSIKIPSIDVGPIHFDGWSGVNLGKIPYLHSGGVVPGTPGSDQLAMLQAGERVVPRGGGGQTTIINIASFIGSDRDIDRLAAKVADRMRTALV